MKNVTVDLRTVKEIGANAAVVLAVVNNSEVKLSNTEVASIVGISFPTAQKILQSLVEDGKIQMAGKFYCKI